MATGQAKIQLIIDLKNRLKAGLGNARNMITSSMDSMKAKVAEMREGASQMFGELRNQIPGLDTALTALGNPIMAITAGILLLVGTYTKAATMASEWQTSLNKVNVTAQLSQKELKGVSDELLIIGKRNTGDLMDVPETFNKIVSAGFDVQTSMATLEPTLKAAKAGFTEAGVAADAATNLMGSTGIIDATKIYDVLFATVNKGKAEFEDIANYLPKIIPGARQVGISLEQTAGAFAFLTATGLKAEAASTALANAMKSLSSPDIVFGTKIKAGFKGIGVDIFDATGKIRDLVSISKDLNKAMAGLTDVQRMKKFASIGLDMESSMAFSKMSQGIDQLKESIDFTTNSQGQLNEAVKAAKHPLDSWFLIWNAIKASMIEAGSLVLPVLGAIGEWFLNNSENLKSFATIVLSVASAWGIYSLVTNAATIGTALLTAGQWALNAAMSANPVGLIITAIGLLIGGLIVAYQRSQTFRAVLAGIMSVASLLADVFIGLGKTIIGAMTFNPDMFIEGAKQAATAVNEIMDGGIKKRFNQGFQGKIDEENAQAAADQANSAKATLAPKGGVKNSAGKPGTPATGSDSAGKTTGTAQQIKNLTINMDAMVKMGDFVSKNPEITKMGKRELEQFFNELATRMIRNLETSYS